MADKKISDLSPLVGPLNNADALPIADNSASQTKKISPKTLLEQAFLLVDNGSIPASKVDSTGGLPAGSVGTTELADASVTAQKLADNSSGVVASDVSNFPGIRIGQVGLDSTTGKFYCWDGSAWVAVKAAGSVNTITTTTGGLLEVTITPTGDTVQITVEFADTTGARQFLAGPTGGAGQISQRAIIGEDLPTASAVEKGAVEVSGGGLTMNGDVIRIDNTVVASGGTFNLCDVDANGLVVAYREISSNDLPIATSSLPGAIRPGVGLVVDGNGTLSQSLVGNPGTYTKVQTDQTGRVTAGTVLTPSDIPDIPGEKIQGGTIPTAVIGDRSIQEIKLADYSTCYVQEGQPSDNPKLGQFWFTPSTSQLRVYGRGSNQDLWLSVGFGALQAQNLRWGGTVNASDSTITTLTDIGVAQGLTAGGPIPTPTNELSGLYFVVDTPGSNINLPNVQGETLTSGDWILCIDQAQGYVALNISAGGGGGGGATKLNDLTDVTITTPTSEQLLSFNANSGVWENTSVISGGTF